MVRKTATLKHIPPTPQYLETPIWDAEFAERWAKMQAPEPPAPKRKPAVRKPTPVR